VTEIVKNKQVWYKSPWVIGWLLLIITVISVNVFMIIKAIEINPGLVVDDFYERGQHYEENISKKLENNLKWKTHYSIDEITMGKATQILFSITDQQDQFKIVDKITLFAYRPADARQDFSKEMTLISKQDGMQYYTASMTFNSKGTWDLLAGAVVDGTDVNYARRIFVKEE
jgi:nitrogen fixation protein FixH